MHPRDRLLKTLRGERADRVPLDAEYLHHPSRDDIAAMEDRRLAELCERVFDETHYWVHVPCPINRWLVTPPQRIEWTSERKPDGETVATGTIRTPKGDLTVITARNPRTRTTWHVKYPCESIEDLKKLASVPWELPEGLAPPPKRADLPEDFDRRGVLRAGASSPFVCVAGATTFEYFLELCATELGLIRELTARCLERIMDVLDVALEGGRVDYVWTGGCEWLTPPMGSPQLYETLVQEQERAIIDRAHAAGSVSRVHCHGNVASTLKRIIERGADYTEPVEPPPDGDIEFAEAKRIAAGRITLGGNLEARILENEDGAAVDQAVRAAFAGGKERMVLATTAGPIGGVTERTLRNYHRMIDLWEELSPLA